MKLEIAGVGRIPGEKTIRTTSGENLFGHVMCIPTHRGGIFLAQAILMTTSTGRVMNIYKEACLKNLLRVSTASTKTRLPSTE